MLGHQRNRYFVARPKPQVLFFCYVQLQHLKKASAQIFQHYIVNPIPDASNPAHSNGWLTSQKRRANRSKKMENQYSKLNDIIDQALEHGCYPTAEQRIVVLRQIAMLILGF